MTIRKWSEWLKGAGEAWENQGNPQTNRGKEVRSYLLKVNKQVGDTPMRVAGRAWKLYKKENH